MANDNGEQRDPVGDFLIEAFDKPLEWLVKRRENINSLIERTTDSNTIATLVRQSETAQFLIANLVDLKNGPNAFYERFARLRNDRSDKADRELSLLFEAVCQHRCDGIEYQEIYEQMAASMKSVGVRIVKRAPG